MCSIGRFFSINLPILLICQSLFSISGSSSTTERSVIESSDSLVTQTSHINFMYDSFELMQLARIASYANHYLVSDSTWNQLKPYFLPLHHPIKRKLDRLFQRERVTLSRETFEKEGFGQAKIRKPENIAVGKNPNFKGYIFKVYFDTQPLYNEWGNWMMRIEGAKSIQACLNRHGYRHFAVPKKWIYPLPAQPSPPSDGQYYRKHFILIAEDMHILSGKKNRQAYKTKINPERLEELFNILTEEGLIDSVYVDNIPFTKNGKIAFVDTEHHHRAPIPYHKLKHCLSPEMQEYWQALIDAH